MTVAGKATHWSMVRTTIRAGGEGAAVGVNAIDKGFLIFEAIRRLEEEWGRTKDPSAVAPGHSTIHPGVVQGGRTASSSRS